MPYLAVIEFMAVIVGSVYGALLAARKGMDAMGVFTVAFAVSLGGGTLRDLFLDRTPLFWIGNPRYPMTVFAIAVFSGLILRHVGRIRPQLLFPDALGMALFSLTGTAPMHGMYRMSRSKPGSICIATRAATSRLPKNGPCLPDIVRRQV